MSPLKKQLGLALIVLLAMTACGTGSSDEPITRPTIEDSNEPVEATEEAIEEPTEEPIVPNEEATEEPVAPDDTVSNENDGQSDEDPPTVEPKPELDLGMVEGVLYVDAISIVIMESFPVQASVFVEGNLADGCTQITGTEQIGPVDNIITLKIIAQKPADMACTMALVPFQQSFPVDVLGLLAGDYILDVNGKQATFNIAVDNVPQDD